MKSMKFSRCFYVETLHNDEFTKTKKSCTSLNFFFELSQLCETIEGKQV